MRRIRAGLTLSRAIVKTVGMQTVRSDMVLNVVVLAKRVAL
ncbi:hypothetical protein SPF06_17900 [Sinomonas sp. JGH33]|uniref:Uncharacterized protein n=1 Tax=Sinomonas terricola TaxID=3110330 RepID=A0ABU5TA85_9MICC|nr:hypothetical protein [Sinomonas sp. JGH33]MEA5456602.1 hypothetical protein [Sinomonas sp. JGH33]